ncbi:hypothetical protein QP922_11925 [Corynebacterium sp. MSK218]|uniref:hypothetical protein n=1 Tax=Corynebacterium sp. MSK218 TaxID=3050218 RepID=UPI00254A37B7|nr:hypothetical protein [Corynebacterium sp. MSK218]MDK8764520.1 hypothetical protein [Corynebacterium sp. MSK218]
MSITEDLVTWAVSNERDSMEGCDNLRKYNVQSPELLLKFPYAPAGPTGEELEAWHGDLWRNYLHWIINNAASTVDYESTLPAWQVKGIEAVREWLHNL